MAEVRVERYVPEYDGHMEPYSKGAWVSYEDYDSLEKSYDTLRKLCGEMLDTLRGMNDEELRLYGRELPIFTRAQEVLNG